mgnify:CR=1 FL=1
MGRFILLTRDIRFFLELAARISIHEDYLKIMKENAVSRLWRRLASKPFPVADKPILHSHLRELKDFELPEADSEQDLSGCNLSNRDLSSLNLTGARLNGADLSNTRLNGAKLRGAQLRGVNLTEAELYGTELANANLNGANLRRADLSGADLRRADLRNANLSDTNLSGADVQGAKFKSCNKLTEDARRNLKDRGAIFQDVLEVPDTRWWIQYVIVPLSVALIGGGGIIGIIGSGSLNKKHPSKSIPVTTNESKDLGYSLPKFTPSTQPKNQAGKE